MFSKLKQIAHLINFKKHRIEILIFCIVILLSALPRFYNLDRLPLGLNQDEAVNGVDAYYLVHYARDHHNNGFGPFLESFSDWASPMLTYMTMPFVYFMGLNIYTIRFVTAFFTVLSVVNIYFINRILKFPKIIVCIITLLYSLSPFLIHISRWAIPPSIVPFWLSLLILLQIICLQLKPSKKLVSSFNIVLFFSILVASALTYSYPTMKLFVPIYYFIFVVLICLKENIFNNFKKNTQRFIAAFSAYFLYLISISPIYIYTLLDSAKYNARFATESITMSGENVIVGFFVRFFSYFTPYFYFFSSDPNKMHVPDNFGILNILGLYIYIFAVYFVYKFIKNKQMMIKIKPNKQNKFSKFNLKKTFENIKKLIASKTDTFYIKLLLLAGLILFPIAASLTKSYFMSLRTIHGLIFIVIIFGFVLNKLIKQNFAFKKYISNLNIYIVSFVLIFTNSIAFFNYYFNEYANEKAGNFNYGNIELVKYFDENQDKYDSAKIDMLSIYYYYIYQPKPSEINFDNNTLIKNKKYAFEAVDLLKYPKLELVKRIDNPTNKKMIWAVYKTPENIWLAKKM